MICTFSKIFEKIIKSTLSLETVQTKAEIGINKIYNELNSKKFSLNINKTFFVAFTIRHVPIIPINYIKIHSCNGVRSDCHNCQKTVRVNKVKYLG